MWFYQEKIFDSINPRIGLPIFQQSCREALSIKGLIVHMRLEVQSSSQVSCGFYRQEVKNAGIQTLTAASRVEPP